MLSQAVTTVWRTELGTTLLDGFNSTTDGSAYFHYLCSYQSAMNRRRQTKFLCRMAPHHAGGSLLGGFFGSQRAFAHGRRRLKAGGSQDWLPRRAA